MDKQYVVAFNNPCFDTEDGDSTEVSECTGCPTTCGGIENWKDCPYGAKSKHYDPEKYKDSGKIYLQTGKERFLFASQLCAVVRQVADESLRVFMINGGTQTVEPKFEKRVLKWFKDRS